MRAWWVLVLAFGCKDREPAAQPSPPESDDTPPLLVETPGPRCTTSADCKLQPRATCTCGACEVVASSAPPPRECTESERAARSDCTGVATCSNEYLAVCVEGACARIRAAANGCTQDSDCRLRTPDPCNPFCAGCEAVVRTAIDPPCDPKAKRYTCAASATCTGYRAVCTDGVCATKG